MRLQCMPWDGTELAAANGARAGTVITNNKRLAVRRCNFLKMVEDVTNFF